MGEWAQREINLPDTELKQYIKTEIFEKVKNVLIPQFKEYEARNSDDASNKIIFGLVHGDLHEKHVLFDANGKVSGVIDWTDMRVSDIAMEFRYFWAKSRSATIKIVSEYKKMRQEINDWRLFDLCLNMYGYIMLSLWTHWSIWLKQEESEFIKYKQLLKDGSDGWKECINSIIKYLNK